LKGFLTTSKAILEQKGGLSPFISKDPAINIHRTGKTADHHLQYEAYSYRK